MPSLTLIYGMIACMAGFALPLILIPIIALTGNSEIVEELAKGTVIASIVLKLPSIKDRLLFGAAFGALFGISEGMLYAGQIVRFGDLDVLTSRFLWTVPMHALTAMIIALSGAKYRWMLPMGVAAAIALHLAFNAIPSGTLQ